MPRLGMNAGKTVFAQLAQMVPHYAFRRLVAQYQGDYKVRALPCWEQFLCMLFAQYTYRDSLRDIELCLRSRAQALYHMGLRQPVARSTLADANEHRDWRIYADLAQKLIERARQLYAQDKLEVALDETVYALDSTTIDLCLELFPWARFRRHKAAIKLHTLMDLRGSIPTLIYLSDGKLHDVNFLDEMPLEPGAYYVMDRGYVDFRRLHRFVTECAFFVTRAKSNFRYQTVLANPPALEHGVRTDQLVVLTSAASAKAYPDRLRRIRFYDAEQERYLTFLTNNIILSASMISQLYKCRWKIELFFKWIKQNLKIKVFYGYSDNAVRTQIWIAVCAYTLVAIVKKELKLEISLSQMLQLISVSVFEKVPLPELFIEHVTIPDCAKTPTTISNQLLLNGI